MNKSEFSAVKNLLSTPQRIVIIPHKNPDGDAIGSCLALHLYLQQKNQQSTIVAPNDYPDFLKWLPGEEAVVNYEKEQIKATELIEQADVIFTLDFNHFSRAGALEPLLEKARTTYIMIDHHQQPGDYATYTYSDVKMSSTCQMVYHFIENLQDTNLVSPEIATCLYAGIMTDTGSFRFPSTTSDTHRVIANLIDKGAKNSFIHEQIFDTNSVNKIQLLGVALKNLRVLEEYHTAYITLSQQELNDHQFKKGDTEGFVNYCLSLKGIVFAAIFIENEAEKIIKISLRSKGSFDVNKFARAHFHGGGHQNAAGGRSDKSLEKTVTYFKETVLQYKKELCTI